MKITSKSGIAQILRTHRESAAVFEKYKLRCASCRGAEEETLAHLASNYGIDVAVFIDELNAAVKK